MSAEKEYEIFISVKNSDSNNNLTTDYQLAEEIYYFLTGRGHRVFLSNINLEEEGVAQFSDAINQALETAQVLIAVGTSRENLESKWVRYEWRSFFNEILSGLKPKGKLFSYISDMTKADLPFELRQNTFFEHGPGAFEKMASYIEGALGKKSRQKNPKSTDVGSTKVFKPSVRIEDPGGYTKSVINSSSELTNEDNLVYKVLCDVAMERERPYGDTKTLQENLIQYNITPELLQTSLEMLESVHLIKITRAMGKGLEGLPLYQITPYGLQRYCLANIPGYNHMVDSVILQIVEFGAVNSNEIANATKLRTIIVDNILEVLGEDGLIKITKYLGGILISKVSPQLKRMAEKL